MQSRIGSPAEAIEGERALSQFFTAERVARLITALVTRFMPNTPEVLQNWDSDPEGYNSAVIMFNVLKIRWRRIAWGLAREYSSIVSPSLLHNRYRHVLKFCSSQRYMFTKRCPCLLSLQSYSHFWPVCILLEMLNEEIVDNSNDPTWVRQKDAAYWAISVGSNDLREAINFEDLLVNHLIKDLSNPAPAYKLLNIDFLRH